MVENRPAMRLHFALTVGLCAAALSAQTSLNVDLLGQLDSYSSYSDVWGYRAASTNKEYALLATMTGTSVIDCTDPGNPVERGFFPGPLSDLRDIKTWSTYAYVVSERGGGIQIIDLTNADAPSLVGTWGGATFTHAHNIAIDIGTGWIYVVGTDVGTVVFDAAANPRAPAVVGIYGSSNVLDYVHDLAIQNGVGHAAMVWTGQYRLLDVTTWPFQTLAEEPTAARFSHNTWPSADDSLAVTTDEQEGGLVQFWDVSNPSAPMSLSVYSPNTTSIPHNAFLVGDLCHVSWFTEGYRVLDVSDPSTPVEIGFYDMFAGASGTSEGAFGVYPFQPSGIVYVSERDRGLFVLRPHALRIHHEALSDTTSEEGPYRVVAAPTSPDPITGVTLRWSADGQSYASVTAVPTGTPGEFAADIPGHYAPATLSYYLTATDAVGGSTRYPAPHAPTSVLSFDVGTRLEVFADDFEVPSGWTHGATSGTDDWEYGATFALGGTSRVAWLDATAAHSGQNLWGNDIGQLAGADGAHPDRTTSWLQSPPIATGNVAGLSLELWRWLSVESGDRARVLVNGQVVWQTPNTQHWQDFTWHEQRMDVGAILDGASTATIRFELQAGAGMELGGWNVDDVALCKLGDCVPAVTYDAGTPGSGAFTPQIALAGAPRIGASFQVEGSTMLGNSAAALVLGAGPARVAFAGVTLLVDPVGAIALPVAVSGAGAGSGSAALPINVPNIASLDDVDLFAQWLVVDPGSPGGAFAASQGLRIRLCRN